MINNISIYLLFKSFIYHNNHDEKIIKKINHDKKNKKVDIITKKKYKKNENDEKKKRGRLYKLHYEISFITRQILINISRSIKTFSIFRVINFSFYFKHLQHFA